MNWQEISQKNRRTIIIVASIIAILIITFIVLFCIKNALYDSNKPQIVEQVEQSPAAISDLDINQYVDKLHSVIRNKYGAALDGYKIATGELLEDGSWYITTIQKPLKDQWSPAQDVFRVILHEVSGTWQIVTEPSLIFTYADYPDIPRAVIYSANNL